jgi:hypothetical protein
MIMLKKDYAFPSDMSLENKITNLIKDFAYPGLVVAYIAFMCYYFGANAVRTEKIKHNLEYNAVYCGYSNNLMWQRNFNRHLPKVRNIDIDRDGKYESVYIDHDATGKKFYQELTVSDDGSRCLGERKPLDF